MVANFLQRAKTTGKYRQIFAAACISALSIYAIMIGHDNQHRYFPSLISSANAQEAKHCALDSQKIQTVKQSADGFFKNLRFADEAYDAKKLSFKDADGKDRTLGEFAGKTLLVNLWAIWCIPCRTEMPELANLKRDMAGENFDVLAINIDKAASREKVQAFLNDVKADNLVFHRDQTMDIFNQLRRDGLALGLPVTMLIDKNGCLIASFNGSAPWGDTDSQTLMKAAVKADAQQ